MLSSQTLEEFATSCLSSIASLRHVKTLHSKASGGPPVQATADSVQDMEHLVEVQGRRAPEQATPNEQERARPFPINGYASIPFFRSTSIPSLVFPLEGKLRKKSAGRRA